MANPSPVHGNYRHPKHDAIAAALGSDGERTNKDIATELHVDRRAVARVRAILDLPVRTRETPMTAKLDAQSTEPDADGHVFWTGRTTRFGTPQIRHCGSVFPAAAVAFQRRTGRPPVGTCRADCGVQHCIADGHVVDDLERRDLRGQERALWGLDPVPWDECPHGHPWATAGRFEPDLTPYCRDCNTARAKRSREAREETAKEA